LSAVIREKGLNITQAADAVGQNRKSFDHWARGRSLPLLATAIEVAERLDRPSLAALALTVRKKTCPMCQRMFVDNGRFLKGIYCGPRCCRTNAARKLRDRWDAADRMASVRLRIYDAAIEQHCRSCEPDGLCRDSECAIQAAGLSPFRVDKRLAIA
jgi:DNA-binding XRE family transcriptional regulator